jgi:peptide/nickel transport system substrate-binding protein
MKSSADLRTAPRRLTRRLTHRRLTHRRLTHRPLLASAAIVLLAGVAACSSYGGGSGSLTAAESKAASSNIAIVPTVSGSTADDIYPLVTGPQVTPYNEQEFQDLMYRPLLWYGGEPGSEFGFYNQLSIGDAPVWSDNDTVVTITLKPWKWSDGQPVTARDVVFFMNLLVADKDNYGNYTPGEFPDNVKSYVAVNPSTVQFTLNRSYSPLWFDTAELTDITPFPQQEWDRTSAGGPVGNYDLTSSGAVAVNKFLISQAQQLDAYSTNPIWQVVDGPWRLKSFSTRGDVDLVPNTAYSGPGSKPRLTELIERPFTSDTAEFNALLAGTGLTDGYIPSEDTSQVPELKSEGYEVYNTLTYGINYIVINFNSPADGYLFRQLYIRQALQELVNQPQDVKYAYGGEATPTYGPTPLAPASPYTTPYEESNPYPYSVTSATSLLSSHGWAIRKGGTDTCVRPGTGPDECGAGIPAGKQLAFKFVYASGSQQYSIMMENYQSSASQAGVTVQLSEGQFNEITGITGVCSMGQSACNWDGVMYGGTTYGVYPTGNGLFNTGANGQGNYSSATADTLISDTMYSSDPSSFTQYVNYLAQQLPMIWMPWQQVEIDNVVLKNLQGFAADEGNPFADTFPENWYYTK